MASGPITDGLRRKRAVALAVVVTLVGSACGSSEDGGSDTVTPPPGVTCAPTTLERAGRQITAERCAPSGAAPSVVGGVVVLGGCTSDQEDQPLEQQVAGALAAVGVVAVVVDYLEAADQPAGTFCAPTEEAIAGLPDVVGVIADAASALGADPLVDGRPVGAVGYSFGGLAALYATIGQGPTAPLPQADFASLVLFAAPTYPEVLNGARAGDLPPTLIFQGDGDETVPVSDSTALQAAATEGGTAVSLTLVPGMDHGWSSASAAAERARSVAVPEATSFLVAQLGGGS